MQRGAAARLTTELTNQFKYKIKRNRRHRKVKNTYKEWRIPAGMGMSAFTGAFAIGTRGPATEAAIRRHCSASRPVSGLVIFYVLV
jgi:hypothetical protein